MFEKKALASSPARTHRKELEYLYARRIAINTLIQSLEEYGRYRAKVLLPPKRRTA